LIATDLAAGTIDLATSLQLRAWALFADPRLPQRYDGAGSRGEDQALFADIANNLDSLPADKHDELARWLLRPTDPNSPFSTAPAAARSAGAFQLAQAEVTPEPHQCTAPRQWFDEPWSPDGNVDHGFKAWACGPSRATVQEDLNKVIAIGSELWPKMTAAEPNGMGPPVPDTAPLPIPGAPATATPFDDGSGKIDVYLVEPFAECRMRAGTCQVIPADEDGEQAAAAAPKDYPEHCQVGGFPVRACSGYMLLRRDRLYDAAFPADFAHEFFHLLQYAHNGKVDITWYHEASAVWAEWYYEQAAAKEDADGHYEAYQDADRSLLWYDYDQTYQYQAWGWPLFQFTEKGVPNVFQTWSGAENADSRAEVDQAIDSQLPFEGTFRDFAVRNAQPNDYIEGASTGLDDYRWQTRPTQPSLEDFSTKQHMLSVQGTEITMGKNSHHVDEVQPLAARYDLYKVKDNNIAQVEIDITGLEHADQADLDVLAQVTTPDNWHRFQATGGKLKLCREKADQNVIEDLEVVISNHAVARDGNGPDVDHQSVKGDYTIEAKDNCDEQPVFLHGTFSGHKDGVLDVTDATFDVTVKWNRPNDFNDPLNFQFVEGSFTFNTTVLGVCAGTLTEGEKLDLEPTNSQVLSYGDDSTRMANASLRDDRADGEARLAFFLNAHFNTPPVADPSCEPPFEPYGDVGGCPLIFDFLTADTLATSASCEHVDGNWTGQLVEQGNP
jgi:hypothetical protein